MLAILASLSIMFPIFEKLGGWPQAERALAARGVKVTEYARLKWPKRGRLPRLVALTLAEEASRAGIEFSVSDFSITESFES